MTEHLDLASNFNRLGIPDALIGHLVGSCFEISSIYAGDSMGCIDLSFAADYFHIPSESIAITDGATEALLLTLRYYTNRPVYIYRPTFWEYDFFAKDVGSSVSYIALDHPNGVYASIDEVIQSVPPGVVVLCNPNNPTGDMISSGDIVNLAQKYPDHIFVIDETYLWFAGEYRDSTTSRCAQKQSNIIVITSLSKICTIPGLRVGLIFADNEVLEQILKGKAPYSVLPIQIEALRCVISSCQTFLAQSSEAAECDRNAMMAYLDTKPEYDYVQPHANFIFIHAKRAGLAEYMLQHGIRVRDGQEFGEEYKNYVRMRLCAEDSEDWKKLVTLLDSFT